MLHFYLFNLKLFLFIVAQIGKTARCYSPCTSFSSSVYSFFFLSAMDDGRTEQIIRIIRMFYILLTNSTGITIGELIFKFGVCERTIYRDLDRFEYAGIPLIRENHRIRLMESDSNERLAKKMIGDGELKIRTKPGKIYDVARALVSSIDSIQGIVPLHMEKWILSEAKRQGRDPK